MPVKWEGVVFGLLVMALGLFEGIEGYRRDGWLELRPSLYVFVWGPAFVLGSAIWERRRSRRFGQVRPRGQSEVPAE